MSFDRSKFLQRYLDDATEHVEKLNKGLLDLEKKYDESILNDLFRTAHTLKGTSRMMKQIDIAQISHRMEDIFDIFRRNKVAATGDTIDKLLLTVDRVSELLKALANGETSESPDDIFTLLDNIVQALENQSATRKFQPIKIDRQEQKEEPVIKNPKKSEPKTETDQENHAYTSETIRIHVDKLDEIVKLMDGIVSAHSRLKQRFLDIQTIEQHYQFMLNQLSKKWISVTPSTDAYVFSDAFPKLFDVQKQLKHMRINIREDVNIQDLLTTEFQEKSLKIRLMPLSTLFNTFHRTVRDMARQFEKKIHLFIQGAETELDKQIIERIEAPLLHMIRNSIDHGIELPEIRKKAGKKETGLIHLSAMYESGNVLIRIKDDGYGIHIQKIKDKALSKGRISKGDLESMTENQLIHLIFFPGFSTSEIVTDISGRGVGLDVVHESIVNDLKGSVRVFNHSDAGCTFEIRLPLTMAMMHLLTVKTVDHVFAIPSVNVDEIVRMPSSSMIKVTEKNAIQLRDALIPIIFLHEILGIPKKNETIPLNLIIVIVKNGDEKLGLIVDELLDEETLVIKSLPGHLKNNQWVSGVVISGKNDIINVLHIPKILKEASNQKRPIIQPVPAEKKAPHILVVDDSLSTREIEKSILESYGYTVSIASDGSEAFEMSHQTHYDLILTDVEMPKTNGFELTRKLRNTERYAQIPIILLTSMDRLEDKKKGIASGANAYIVKGDFDQSNLIDVIESLIGVPKL
ncbi:MAG: response regulator [Candidatus Magnetomorum sp.]|nr:response regulator [Candidatus Magnetomorum sp.]